MTPILALLLVACAPLSSHLPPDARTAPDADGALPDGLDPDPTAGDVTRFVEVPASDTVRGFRYPEGSATVRALGADTLHIDVQYTGPSGEPSRPTTWYDSSWRKELARGVPTPPRMDFCVHETSGVACSLDPFLGREGRYTFTATASFRGAGATTATWTTTFVPEDPAVRILEVAPDGQSHVAEISQDRTTQTVVRLYGTPKERGFAQGWLLGDEIVDLLETVLAPNFQQGSRIVRTQFGNICYDSRPFRTQYETLRENISSSMDLPEEIIDEMEGIVEGMAAANGGAAPTFTLGETDDCKRTTRAVGVEDLIVLNTLDDFCRSFTVWGERVVDAGPKDRAGSILASSIEWMNELAPFNHLFVHFPTGGRSFLHASWSGYVVAYGPVMNEDGLATAGIMSNPGRLPYGGDIRISTDFWYHRLYMGAPPRQAMAAELRRAIAVHKTVDDLAADLDRSLGSTFTNHATTLAGPVGTSDAPPLVLEANWEHGVGTRTEGTCADGGCVKGLDFPHYVEDDYLASTWCGQFLFESSNREGDPDFHCQDDLDGDDPSAPYFWADDYDRIGAQVDPEVGHDRVGLAEAWRILHTVAEDQGVLHFVLVLPDEREILLGTSTPDSPNGGDRENQLLLSWDVVTKAGL